jgi:exo-beta-1,3-glucanase (GH17 family)
MKRWLISAFLIFAAFTATVAGAAAPTDGDSLVVPGWHGNAIAYSGFRLGQHPDLGPLPTDAQTIQDLRILEKNWKFIRLYSSGPNSEDVLRLIRREKIGLKVMLGAWLSGDPEKLNANSLQIVRAIRLANEYPDIVVAVNVGNEILVSWSDHKLTEEQALAYVAQVKSGVRCLVTLADDSLYWRNPAAKLADAVDFITMHTYPMWNGEDIDTALASTIRVYEIVRDAHRGKTIVMGEAGWASFANNAKNVPGAGNETKQQRYYEELTAWAKANGVTVFVFEAFDEPWKGSGTEGHWGLFNEDRTAKQVMRGLYPEPATGPSSSAAAPQTTADLAQGAGVK